MINILGAGAIGCLWAAFCEHMQIPYRLYSRQPEKTRQIEVKSADWHSQLNLRISDYREFVAADIHLICVKAFALEELIKRLGPLLWTDSVPVLMMNGMGLDAPLRRAGYTAPPIQASFVQGAKFESAPFHKLRLVHTGNAPTSIGYALPDNPHFAPQTEIADTLNQILPPVQWKANQYQLLWLKLLVNAVINPLTAIHQQPNGSLLVRDRLCSEALALLEEAWPIAEAPLAPFSIHDVQRNIEQIARQTRDNHSSMLQDINAGRTTEIDFINGFLLRQAENQGIDLPQHRAIVNAVKKAAGEV